jgi:hypothetical protein
MSTRKLAAAVLCLALGAIPVPAQEKAAASELDSTVPELTAFHEIIYPIWHTAYPEKDVGALKGFVPEVNALAAKVFAAKLPGILRDKEAKWQAGLAEFKDSVAAYNDAAKGDDAEALLAAAELLHAKYEALVRTIRPVLKQMDEFHKVLYVVFHKSLPDKKWEEIRGFAPELRAKAEAIGGAKLPARLEPKTAEFRAAVEDLVKASAGLEETSKGTDAAATEEAVLKLHARYQALEKIFD